MGFLINLFINDEEKLNKNIKIFLVVYYFLSLTFYKIGILLDQMEAI